MTAKLGQNIPHTVVLPEHVYLSKVFQERKRTTGETCKQFILYTAYMPLTSNDPNSTDKFRVFSPLYMYFRMQTTSDTKTKAEL